MADEKQMVEQDTPLGDGRAVRKGARVKPAAMPATEEKPKTASKSANTKPAAKKAAETEETPPETGKETRSAAKK